MTRPPPLLDTLRTECLPRPGRLETASWRLRWDSESVVVCPRDSLDEPWRVSGARLDGLVLQLSRSVLVVRAGTVKRLLGAPAVPQRVERLHVELRGGELPVRVRLWAAIDDPALLEGLDELALDGDEVDESRRLIDLLHTVVALGGALARSSGVLSAQATAAALVGERDRHVVESGRLRRERDALDEERSALAEALAEARTRVGALEREVAQVERLRREVAGLEHQLREARAAQEAALARASALERTQRELELQRAPSATAHNLAAPVPETEPESLGVVCPRCQGERGESVALSPTALLLGGSQRARLAGCPRCGWAGFVRLG